MSMSLIFRAVIVALSLAGVAYVTVAIALSLVPVFYAWCLLSLCVVMGLVAIEDI